MQKSLAAPRRQGAVRRKASLTPRSFREPPKLVSGLEPTSIIVAEPNTASKGPTHIQTNKEITIFVSCSQDISKLFSIILKTNAGGRDGRGG